MPEVTRAVYLEDVEATIQSTTQTPTNSQESTVDPGVGSGEKKTATVTVKRQRTLMDMFSSPKDNKSSEPGAKRLKLSGSGSKLSSGSANGAPSESGRVSVGNQSLNSIPFSLSAYQESLSEEQRKLLQLECDVMGKSWLKVLKDEIKKPYFISLKRFLWEEGVRGAEDSLRSLRIYPSRALPPEFMTQRIYMLGRIPPLGRVKVVILGQDPYHGAGQAHGLCFSVPKGVPVPPSLKNIYAEIKAEYPAFNPPRHGNLSAWAENGVLLLNTCLTVKAGMAGSHAKKGWEEFTEQVINVVDKYGGANLGNGFGRGVVFLAWGSWAAKRVAKLNKSKHLILTSAHPSPLSANKGFLGNGHFKMANEWLETKYGADAQVDWCKLDPEPIETT